MMRWQCAGAHDVRSGELSSRAQSQLSADTFHDGVGQDEQVADEGDDKAAGRILGIGADESGRRNTLLVAVESADSLRAFDLDTRKLQTQPVGVGNPTALFEENAGYFVSAQADAVDPASGRVGLYDSLSLRFPGHFAQLPSPLSSAGWSLALGLAGMLAVWLAAGCSA